MAKRLILALMAVCIAAVVRVTEGDCGEAPQLENGTPTAAFITHTSFAMGTKLTYECYPGYKFQEGGGSRLITCKEDSTWTPLRAVCEPKSCGNPGDVPNGYSEVANNTFGSRALFFCDEGYMLVGQNYRLCADDGWQGKVPRCDTVICADPPSIPNGNVPILPDILNWEYGMVAKYSCIADYSLIGRDPACAATGKWDIDPPKCKVVECQHPEKSAHVRIISGFRLRHKYRETITYRCNEGYEMVGNSVIECSENNTFVPPPPTCKLTTAIPPTAPPTSTKVPPTAAPTYLTGIIVGIVIGILVLLIIAVAIYCILKQKGSII